METILSIRHVIYKKAYFFEDIHNEKSNGVVVFNEQYLHNNSPFRNRKCSNLLTGRGMALSLYVP
jgi:hypothetical protein